MKNIIKLLLITFILLLSCCSRNKMDDPKLRLNYVNLKYMFTIQFSEKWINYMDFERTEIIDPQINIPVIYFALPTKSREWQPLNIPTGYAELFCVKIFTKPVWKLYQEKYKGTDEFKLNDKLPGEGKNFVYMISYPDSLPVDLYLYMKESIPITDSFIIIKKD